MINFLVSAHEAMIWDTSMDTDVELILAFLNDR